MGQPEWSAAILTFCALRRSIQDGYNQLLNFTYKPVHFCRIFSNNEQIYEQLTLSAYDGRTDQLSFIPYSFRLCDCFNHSPMARIKRNSLRFWPLPTPDIPTPQVKIVMPEIRIPLIFSCLRIPQPAGYYKEWKIQSITGPLVRTCVKEYQSKLLPSCLGPVAYYLSGLTKVVRGISVNGTEAWSVNVDLACYIS